MGWAHAVLKGREIGYAVEATCDHPGCEEAIDRGLAYCCGDLEGVMGERGCGGYFCYDHLLYGVAEHGQRCPSCSQKIEDEATRMAVAAEMGASEWEAFVRLAEEKLYEDGALVHAE
jgi:hypothetical protein